jgi:chloramphenicol-sensitive protein RarD
MESRKGIWYAVAAWTVWGLSPVFWNLVPNIGATMLLLHRIIWSVVILAIVLFATGQWRSIRSSYRSWRSRLYTVAAALLVFANWAIFLWAVTNDHIVEASLGYFINPLVSVALGVVFLGERLRPLQWSAVAIAAAGVAAMAIRVGSVPWISLVLALSFGTYGLIKKNAETPSPFISLFGESTFLSIPALIALMFIVQPSGASFGDSPSVSLFLVSTGLITVVPLALFAAATKRIPLATVGVLQYIAPSLQFALGVFLYGEAMTQEKLVGFIVVWIALILYSFDTWRTPSREPVVV